MNLFMNLNTWNTQNDEQNKRQFFVYALFVLVFLLICRIIASYFVPLNDPTEARYSEIARKMLETSNWVTPQHDYGIPFWAKPPLSTWLSAISMKVFGVNEFAARLPELLLSMGILYLIWDLAKKHSGPTVAIITVLVLSGTLYFFLDAGSVMTDPSLLFCTCLANVSFWRAIVDKNKLWSYIFFVALGLGLLAKGPLILVLVGMPIFFWVLIRNEWVNLWRQLPWIKGSVLLLVIALPWYILAEMRTPGFLNYFIIGEHIHRFLTPGWTGDKYGTAHHAYKGMIWIYALAGLFPWSLLGSRWIYRNWKVIPVLCNDEDGWVLYLLCCVLSPLVFFTFASNIIYPYVLPSIPAFALFFAEMWSRTQQSLEKSKWILKVSSISGLIFLVVTLAFVLCPDRIAKSNKPLITAWKNQHPEAGTKLIYWNAVNHFSAQFYAAGKVDPAWNVADLCKLLSNHKENYLALKAQEVTEIPTELISLFKPVAKVYYNNIPMLLLRTPVLSC